MSLSTGTLPDRAFTQYREPAVEDDGSSISAAAQETPSDGENPTVPAQNLAPVRRTNGVQQAYSQPQQTHQMSIPYQPIRMIMPLPSPEQQGAPHFKGSNVTRFLRRWEELCANHGIAREGMVSRLPQYMEDIHGDYVRSLPSWQEGDWNDLKTQLLRDFKTDDADHVANSRRFLEALKDSYKNSSDLNEQLAFCRTYKAKSAALSPLALDPVTRGTWFLQGLSKEIRKRVINRCNLTMDDPSSYADFNRLYEQASTAIRQALNFQELDGSDHGEQVAKKIVRLYRNSDGAKAEPTLSSGINEGSESKMVDKVTSLFADLSVNLMRQVEASKAPRAQPYFTEASQTQRSAAPRGATPATGANAMPIQQRSCILGDGEHRKSDCPIMRKWQTQGKVHFNEKYHLCKGRRGEGGGPIAIDFRSGVSTRRQVEEAIGEASPAVAQFIVDEDLRESAVYDRHISVDVIQEDHSEAELEDPYEVAVAAIRAQQEKLRKDVLRPNQKDHRIQKAKAQLAKDVDIAQSKAARTGRYVPVPSAQDSQIEDVLVPLSTRPETRAPLPRKIPRTMRLDRALSKDAEPGGVFEALMSSSVSLTVKELMSVAPSVAKLMFQRVKTEAGEAVDEPIEAVHARAMVASEDFDQDNYVTVASPRASVLVGPDKVSADALMDSGAECNLMSLRDAMDLRLPTSPLSSLTLNGAVDTGVLIGYCPEVEITIGGVSTVVPFLLSDAPGTQFILGMPFERKARLSTMIRDDGVWEGTIWSQDGQTVAQFCGTRSVDKRNRTIEQLKQIHPKGLVSQ